MEYQSKELRGASSDTDTDSPRSPLAAVGGDCISSMISIESSDGRIFQVNEAHTFLSKLLRDAISMEESDNENGDDDTNDDMNALNESSVIPLQLVQLINVQFECLQHIVSFMKQYAQEPMVDIRIQEEGAGGGGGSFTDIVQQEWYSSMLFQLVTAADYMDIQTLLSLTCWKVSSDLMGKSPKQIRDILNIPKLSATEETEAREKHSWMIPDSS
jgi:S-phase kinase-associated protein 1